MRYGNYLAVIIVARDETSSQNLLSNNLIGEQSSLSFRWSRLLAPWRDAK